MKNGGWTESRRNKVLILMAAGRLYSPFDPRINVGCHVKKDTLNSGVRKLPDHRSKNECAQTGGQLIGFETSSLLVPEIMMRPLPENRGECRSKSGAALARL
jgi:hypothetical protein